MVSRRVLSAAIGVCLLTGILQPQAAAAQDDDDVVRLASTEVLLDVVVTDSRGRPILDLKPDELEVTENGDKQTVTSFGLVQVGAAAATRTTVPASLVESPFRDYNLIIIVVDRTSIRQLNLREVNRAAQRFVNERLAPHDLVAVFACSSSLVLLQNFTNDKARLSKALETATQTAGGTNDVPMLADTGAIDASILVSGAASLVDQAQPGGALAAAADLAQRLNQIALGIEATLAGLRDQMQATALITDLIALIRLYGHIKGRKSLLLYSEGFAVNSTVESAFSSMIGAANRSNFACYTIDAAGLRTNAPGPAIAVTPASSVRNTRGDNTLVDIEGNSGLGRAEKAMRSSDNSALNRLAAETGGVALRNSNDLGRGFDAVEADLRCYYAISYAPSRTELDGRYRSIGVNVTRKGAEVRVRSGYYAVPAADGLALPYEQPLLAMLAMASPPADIPLFVRIEKFPTKAGWLAPITVAVDATALAPLPAVAGDAAGSARYEVDALVVLRDSSRRIVAQLSSPTRVTAAAPLGSASGQALTLAAFPGNVTLAPGVYTATIVARDAGSQKGVVVERSFKLGELGKAAAPVLSSLVLSRATEPVAAPDAARWAADPLVFDGTVRIIPNAMGQFVKSRGDQLVAFFRVYGEPSHQYSAKMVFTKANAVVLQTQPAPLTATNAEGVTAFAPAFPLDSFEPGAYMAQLSILGADGSTPVATATASFRVDP